MALHTSQLREDGRRYRTVQKFGQHLFIALIIYILAWSFLFPSLNWPDEIYKIRNIGIDRNVYLLIIDYLRGPRCSIYYSSTPQSQYLSYTINYTLSSGHGCYYRLKIANCLASFALILLSAIVLRRKEPRVLFFSSLLWPSTVFQITAINQQSFFIIVSMFLMVLYIENRSRYYYLLAISIACLYIDRSFFSIIVFMSFHYLISYNRRLALVSLFILIAAAYILRPYIASYELFGGGDSTIGEMSERLAKYNDNPVTSLGLLFVSFVYLGGNNSIPGLGIDYIIVMFTLMYMYYYTDEKLSIRIFAYSFVLSFFLVISFIPTIQTFRYYCFIMPFLLIYLANTPRKLHIYFGYCIIMNVAYIIEGALLA